MSWGTLSGSDGEASPHSPREPPRPRAPGAPGLGRDASRQGKVSLC